MESLTKILLGLLFSISTSFNSFALKENVNANFTRTEIDDTQDTSSILEQYVGCWYPDVLGWHGEICITFDGNKLYLKMTTDEGDKIFEDVEVNESEHSIHWTYREQSYARWYIGRWKETNRNEILVDSNCIYASCGVPTEIYNIGVEASHSVKEWRYMAVVVNDELVVSYGYKWDFLSPANELVFMKLERYMSAFTYRMRN